MGSAVGSSWRGIGRGRRPSIVGPLIWTLLAQSLLGLAIVALPGEGARAVATAVFLLVTPTLAVFLVLRTLDLLARTILATATALVVNAVVAEVMVVTGAWSLAGGAAAVALIAVAIAVFGGWA
jgi:uncharacterized membrane protein